MEISSLYTKTIHGEGAELQIKDQFGKDMDCFITLVGIDSKQWREVLREAARAALLGEDQDQSANTLAKASIAWRGFQDDGSDVEFTEERCSQLYDEAPYIKDQVDRFIADRVNFTES